MSKTHFNVKKLLKENISKELLVWGIEKDFLTKQCKQTTDYKWNVDTFGFVYIKNFYLSKHKVKSKKDYTRIGRK